MTKRNPRTPKNKPRRPASRRPLRFPAQRGVKVARKLPKPARVLGLSSSVAKSIALPWGHAAIRLPSVLSQIRTSTLELNAASQSIGIAVNNPTLADGTQRYMLTSSPVSPVWADTNNKWPRVTAYVNTNGTYNASGGSLGLTIITPGTFPERFQDYTISGDGVEDLASHPNAAPIGVAHGCDYLYVPAGQRVSFYIKISAAATTLTTTGTFSGDAEVIVDNDVRTQVLVFTGVAAGVDGLGANQAGFRASFLADTNVWLRWRSSDFGVASITLVGASAITIEHLIVVTEPAQNSFGGYAMLYLTRFMPFPPSNFLENDVNVYSECRMTANSLLLSNTTAVVNLEGSVFAGRLDSNRFDVFNGNQVSLSTLPPLEKYNGLLRNGVYSFLPPGQDVELRQHIRSFKVERYTPVIHLDNLGSTNLIILADQSTTTTSQMNVTVDFHLEFCSCSQKFPIGVSLIPITEYQAAVIALARAGYFYENPTHVGAVAAAVMRGLQAAWPVLRPAMVVGAKAAANHMLTTFKGMATQSLQRRMGALKL